MNYRLAFICVCCVSVQLPFGFAQVTDLDTSLADSLVIEKKYYEAVTEYKRFLFSSKKEKHHACAYWNMGVCYAHVDQPAVAMEMFEKSFLFPESDTLQWAKRLSSGRYYLLHEKYDLAASTFRHVPIEMHDVAFYRGVSLLLNFDPARCKETIDSAYTVGLNKPNMDRLLEAYNIQMNLKLVSPRKAVFLSSVVAGSGQFYSGKKANGIHSFLLNFLFIYFSVKSFSEKEYLQGVAFTYIFSRFYIRNIMNAKSFANEHNENIKSKFRSELRSSLSLAIDVEMPLVFKKE